MKWYEVFHQTSLRWILKINGYFIHDVQRGDFEQAGVRTIETFISVARLWQYAGHLVRMSDERCHQSSYFSTYLVA